MNNRLILPLVSALALALAAGQAGAQESALDALVAPPSQEAEVVVAEPVEPAVVQDADMVFQPVPYQPMPSPLQMDDEDIRNDDLVRDIARYRTRESRLSTMTNLEAAHLAREKARIQARLELLEQQALLAAGGKPAQEERRQEEERQAEQAEATPVYVPPAPVVRSIYGHGDNIFAEIYIGATKIVATPGTMLSTGERVVDINPSGVVVVKGGRRQVLQVAGSAGTTPVPLSR